MLIVLFSALWLDIGYLNVAEFPTKNKNNSTTLNCITYILNNYLFYFWIIIWKLQKK